MMYSFVLIELELFGTILVAIKFNLEFMIACLLTFSVCLASYLKGLEMGEGEESTIVEHLIQGWVTLGS
jgi:hypothetical protein